MLYYLCKVFFSKYSLSSQMSIQLFRNRQTRCKSENELYYARHVYFLMVAYYDLSLLYLDKLIAEIKQSFNEMKTCYITIWTVGKTEAVWLLACTGRGVLFEHWAGYFNTSLNRDFAQDARVVNSELLFSNGAVQRKHQLITRYFDRLMDVKYAW